MSDVPISLLQSYENGVSLRPVAMEKLAPARTTLEAVGIEFTDGDTPGVKLRDKAEAS